MRLSLAALFLLTTSASLAAETIAAKSRVTQITLYPEGAEVTRLVEFSAPAGQHDLLITDIPSSIEAEYLRLASSGDMRLGAFALRSDRLPPRDDADTQAQAAARTALEAAEAGQRQAEAGVATVTARIEAADAQAGFLRAVGGQMPDSATPESLRAISQMIGAEVLVARQAAIAARADLWQAEAALKSATEAVEKSRAALETLSGGDTNAVALNVAVTLSSEGPQSMTVTHYVADAHWRPVYDITLARKGTPSLTISRGVLVSQASGEDWAGVDLTLSTAQPSQQAEPSQLWPDLRRIGPKPEPMAKTAMADAPEALAEPVMEPAVVGASATIEGDVVVYRYPAAVDLATGVEDLRLALDELTFAPTIEARAVPRMDKTAFLMARVTNTSGEVLLPGNAFLLRDGTLVGGTWFEGIAPGEDAELAFGPIEALRLTRAMPTRAEGDRGLLSKSSQIEEEAVLTVENLGSETWPVRLLDQVPYSEQEDLSTTFDADPAPSETDVDGKRGILAWTFDLAPGAVQEIRLSHVLRWPDGMDLQ